MKKLLSCTTFLFIIICGCRKYDLKVSDKPLPEMKARFTAILDGARVTWQADSVGYTDTSFVYTEPRIDSSFNSYISELQKPTRKLQIVRERQGYQGNSPSQFDFKNFFLVGNYSFFAAAPNFVSSGFTILYTDGGTQFTTAGAGAAQSPGSFRIVSQVDGVNSRGEYQVDVVCKFNCVLYATSGGGNTKSVTQAEFRGSFVSR